MNNAIRAQQAAAAGMAGALLWLLSVLMQTLFGLETGASTGPLYLAHQAVAFLAMGLIGYGYLGIAWGGGVVNRFGRVSTALVGLGYGLVIAGGILALILGNGADSPLFLLFPLGGLLTALGVLFSGIAVARAGSWRGWQRWVPLLYAAFLWLAVEIPLVAGLTDGPGMWGELGMGVGLFLVALGTSTAAGAKTVAARPAGQ